MKEKAASAGEDKIAAERATRTERRNNVRWRIEQSVRICSQDTKLSEEVGGIWNVSSDGVYFTTWAKHYYVGMALLIAPLNDQGYVRCSDYLAEVSRIDQLSDGRRGIAARFHTVESSLREIRRRSEG